MIIALSGLPGSGKTSVSKLLAQTLGMNFYSVGGLRGKMALERGMTINELNALGETDSSTDTIADDFQRELGKKTDNFVIEGRLSWYFIPHAFKILLTCDMDEAAKRIFLARQASPEDRADEPMYSSPQDALEKIQERMASDQRRYQKYYQIDYLHHANYDLIVDTTHLNGAQATTDAILAELKKLNKIT